MEEKQKQDFFIDPVPLKEEESGRVSVPTAEKVFSRFIGNGSETSVSNENGFTNSDSEIKTNLKYAGFWIRWVASFIDSLILFLIFLPISFIVNKLMGFSAENVFSFKSLFIAGNLFFLNILMAFFYSIFMTKKYRATLGKMVFGIEVISEKSEFLSLKQVVLRELLGKFLSMISIIGYLLAGFAERKRALHDMVAKTVVVYKDPEKKFSTLAIFCIVLFVIFPFLFPVLFFNRFKNVRGRAQDVAVVSSINTILQNAVDYKSKFYSYKGFKVEENKSKISIPCNNVPIINISSDGEKMVIFMESCKERKKYFCANPETGFVSQVADADDSYVRNNALKCSNEMEELENFKKENAKNISPHPSGSNSAILSNVFRDDFLGYEINYPGDWVQERSHDPETGFITISFFPKNPDVKFSINVQSVKLPMDIDDKNIDKIAGSYITGDPNMKVLAKENYVYNFSEGGVLVGRKFIADYEMAGQKFKYFFVVVPYGKIFYSISFVSSAEEYESNYSVFLDVLSSWKIYKK